MKKLLALLMVLTMFFSLAACGDDGDGGGGGSSSDRKKDYSYIKDETLKELVESGEVSAVAKTVTTSDFKRIYEIIEEEEFEDISVEDLAELLQGYGLDVDDYYFDDGEEKYFQSGNFMVIDEYGEYYAFDVSKKLCYMMEYDDEYYEITSIPFDYFGDSSYEAEMITYVTVDSNEIICSEFESYEVDIIYDWDGKIVGGYTDEYYFTEDFKEITEDELDEKFEEIEEEIEDKFDIYSPV